MSSKSRMAARIALAAFFIVLAASVASLYSFYVYDIYPLNQAMGWVSRAQSGGYANDMIGYMNMAKELLKSKQGNPCWVFPTSYTDWDMIKTDLDRQISRLEGLAQLDPNTAAYTQGLDDVRGKLATLYTQIDSTIRWEWSQETNVILAVVAIITEVVLFVITIGYWDG